MPERPLVVTDRQQPNRFDDHYDDDGHEQQQYLQQRTKSILVGAYVSAMGVCGLVLVALGSTLLFLAANVGRRSTDIGSVFLARGAGSISGAIVCAKLYRWFPGNHVMATSLFALMILLAFLPYCRQLSTLHFYFFCLGLGTAVTDTGCQLMTRKLHGREAGPWLGLNATVFGLSASLVPLLEIIAPKTETQFIILSLIVGGTCAFMLYASQIAISGGGGSGDGSGSSSSETQENVLSSAAEPMVASNDDECDREVVRVVPHYRTEMVIAVMLFCFVGGSIAATAYLESYVDQTAIIDRKYKSKLVFVLWSAITVGRFVGIQDQIALSDWGLSIDLSMFCAGGFLAMALIYLYPTSPWALWIGTAGYGFFHGPTVGFCHDLNNRLTLPTEQSMAIVMFGLNVGASVVPYATTLWWNFNGEDRPIVLIVVVGMSMLLPLPLLYLSKRVSYHKTIPDFDGYHRLSAQSYSSHNPEKAALTSSSSAHPKYNSLDLPPP